MCCYWVEWGIKYEKMLKQKFKENNKKRDSKPTKEQILKMRKIEQSLKAIDDFLPRKFVNVESKFKKNFIWIYWQIILYYANHSNSKIVTVP